MPARLVTAHAGLIAASIQVAGGFFAVYLLKSGVSLPLTILAYAATLVIRFFLRFMVLALVRRLGLRRTLVLGTIVRAAQFVPLIYGGDPVWLAVWVLTSALADALYWPVFHALMSAVGEAHTRGSQLGTLEAIRALAGIAGPALGGWLLAIFGGGAIFALGAAIQLLALLPLWPLPDVPAGPIPSLRRSLNGDRLGFLLAASDGWLTIGWWFVWGLALFQTLGEDFAYYGGAMAFSGMVAALLGLAVGRTLDLGHTRKVLLAVSTVMVIGIAARALAVGHPTAAFLVNALSALASSFYTPTYMTTLYNRAKQHGALAFTFFAEAGWDTGSILACGMAAAVAASGLPLSFAILPALLGMLGMHCGVLASARYPAQAAAE
ncbi:MAG TPA: MFS transporter [Aliidongia sp.]|nr:MFS transporter [Aliidongia sp.]